MCEIALLILQEPAYQSALIAGVYHQNTVWKAFFIRGEELELVEELNNSVSFKNSNSNTWVWE